MEGEPKSKRVLLVDDNPAILSQVAQLLRGEFDVVEMLRDGTSLPEALARSSPDLIVLDIGLPGVSGIELARRLTNTGCPARIVFLTVHEDADFAREALAVGGLGYVVKPRLGTDLLAALRAAVAGRYFISPCPALQEFIPLSGTYPSPATREADGAAWVANHPALRAAAPHQQDKSSGEKDIGRPPVPANRSGGTDPKETTINENNEAERR